MTRVGASVSTVIGSSPSSRCKSSPQCWPTDPPRNVTGRADRPSRLRARATLFPLPPTTSRIATPRTRSPRRQLGTVKVLSRHGFNVTHRIIGKQSMPRRKEITTQTNASHRSMLPSILRRLSLRATERCRKRADQPQRFISSTSRVQDFGCSGRSTIPWDGRRVAGEIVKFQCGGGQKEDRSSSRLRFRTSAPRGSRWRGGCGRGRGRTCWSGNRRPRASMCPRRRGRGHSG